MFHLYFLFKNTGVGYTSHSPPIIPNPLTRDRGEKDFATLSNASRLQVPWCHRWMECRATGDDGHPKEKICIWYIYIYVVVILEPLFFEWDRPMVKPYLIGVFGESLDFGLINSIYLGCFKCSTCSGWHNRDFCKQSRTFTTYICRSQVKQLLKTDKFHLFSKKTSPETITHTNSTNSKTPDDIYRCTCTYTVCILLSILIN